MAKKKKKVKQPAARKAAQVTAARRSAGKSTRRPATSKSSSKTRAVKSSIKARRAPTATVESKPLTKSAPAPVAAGSFIWHELASTDAPACRSFYSKMFGWRAADTEMMPGFMYTMFSRDGQDVAGMLQMGPEWGDVKPHWTLYVAVRNVDAAVQKAEALGGEVHVPPHNIPAGRISVIKDPSGALIALIKPAAKAKTIAPVEAVDARG